MIFHFFFQLLCPYFVEIMVTWPTNDFKISSDRDTNERGWLAILKAQEFCRRLHSLFNYSDAKGCCLMKRDSTVFSLYKTSVGMKSVCLADSVHFTTVRCVILPNALFLIYKSNFDNGFKLFNSWYYMALLAATFSYQCIYDFTCHQRQTLAHFYLNCSVMVIVDVHIGTHLYISLPLSLIK